MPSSDGQLTVAFDPESERVAVVVIGPLTAKARLVVV